MNSRRYMLVAFILCILMTGCSTGIKMRFPYDLQRDKAIMEGKEYLKCAEQAGDNSPTWAAFLKVFLHVNDLKPKDIGTTEERINELINPPSKDQLTELVRFYIKNA